MNMRPHRLRSPLLLAQDRRGAIAITFLLTFSLMLSGALFAIDMVRYDVAQSRLQNALDTAVISAGRQLAVYEPDADGPGDAWKESTYHLFLANMPDKFLGADVPRSAVHIGYAEDGSGSSGLAQQVMISATGELPLLSTGFIPQTSMRLYASNQAERRVRNDVEIVLALDSTGSMDDASGLPGKTRMDVLKESANALIDTVLDASATGSGDASHSTYIGLVPFSGFVNVRNIPSAKLWLDYPVFMENYIDKNWPGCISEPAGNWSRSNPLPASVLTPESNFLPVYGPYVLRYTPAALQGSGNTFNYLVREKGFSFDPPSSGYPDERVLAQFENTGTDGHIRGFDIFLAQEPQDGFNGPPLCTTSKVWFLSRERDPLKKAIDAMTPLGATNIAVGLLWSWRMLHPAWRGPNGWGSPDLPRDSEPGRSKVIVLLSDGDNEPGPSNHPTSNSQKAVRERFRISYDYVHCNDQECKNPAGPVHVSDEPAELEIPSSKASMLQQWVCPFNGLRIFTTEQLIKQLATSPAPNFYLGCALENTAIGYSGPYFSGSDEVAEEDALDNYTSKLCDNIKQDQNKISIYALTLGDDTTSTGKALMRQCASSPDMYFDVSDAAKLPEAFAKIAGALTELRLTR